MVDFKGILYYLVIGWEGDNPGWYPAELFTVVDHALPGEWYFRRVGNADGIRAIWGYWELVMSDEHYAQLVDLEPQAIDIFVMRMPIAKG